MTGLAEEIDRTVIDPAALLRPRRAITGMSAVLLPFSPTGEVDWGAFERLVDSTVAAGLIPAVNMDTGYGPWLDGAARVRALVVTQRQAGKAGFVAGAFVADQPGDGLNVPAYQRAMDEITARGGIPVIFQSYGLTSRAGPDIAAAYARLGEHCGRFIAFELGTMFAPFGAIYDLDTYEAIVHIPQCIGAKHSSLDRELEWRRLILRDRTRPEFMVLTGNDLAIDMVIYGSDYLLGLSAFAPELFARRDAMWAAGDHGFYAMNDLLQYLGRFAFRPPVPAYKHSAAQFLKLRGRIGCDRPHPQCPRRPESDLPILRQIAAEMESWDQS